VRRLLFAAVIVMIASAGCIKPRPDTRPQAGPLEVPPPPPRVVVPPEPEQPPEETAPDQEPEAAKEKRPTRPRPQPPRERTETAKPEVKPDAPPADAVVKPPVAPPVAPLQPTLPASTQAVAKQVEAQLAQARKDLGRVDVRGLSADAKSQWETATRFVEQAGTALREGNVVFAQKLAEKAVGLAANLVPR
jgi:outer membrane biosynthesis protein TonB